MRSNVQKASRRILKIRLWCGWAVITHHQPPLCRPGLPAWRGGRAVFAGEIYSCGFAVNEAWVMQRVYKSDASVTYISSWWHEWMNGHHLSSPCVCLQLCSAAFPSSLIALLTDAQLRLSPNCWEVRSERLMAALFSSHSIYTLSHHASLAP